MGLKRPVLYVLVVYLSLLVLVFFKFQLTIHKHHLGETLMRELYQQKPWNRKLQPYMAMAKHRHGEEDRGDKNQDQDVVIYTYPIDTAGSDTAEQLKEKTKRAPCQKPHPNKTIPQYMYNVIDDIAKSDSYMPPSDCRTSGKQKHFVFIKTHKCASDTVSAIGRRFALQHSLSLVLPLGYHYLLGWPYQMEPFMYRKRKTEHYDILLDHVVYNRTKLSLLMPRDTVYFTILRNPINRLMSAVHYFGIGPCSFMPYNSSDYMNITHEYLRDMEKYEKLYTSLSNYFNVRQCACVPKGLSMVKNAMAFDVGFTSDFHVFGSDQSNNYTHIEAWLREIHKDMTFVMITEYFHESMVYLKRVMCWSTKDILYIRLNDWKHPPQDFPEHLIQNFQNWTNVDTLLYKLFRKVLLTRISRLGQDFQKEVSTFIRQRFQVEKFCTDLLQRLAKLKRNHSLDYLHFKATDWSTGYTVTVSECRLMFDESHLRQAVKLKYDDMVDRYPYIQQPLAPIPGFLYC